MTDRDDKTGRDGETGRDAKELADAVELWGIRTEVLSALAVLAASPLDCRAAARMRAALDAVDRLHALSALASGRPRPASFPGPRLVVVEGSGGAEDPAPRVPRRRSSPVGEGQPC